MIDIYNYSQLACVTKDGVVNTDIVIRGEDIKSLRNVREINGSLGISYPLSNSEYKETVIESLGELSVIHGDFWIAKDSCKNLLTLGGLKAVDGTVNISNSNVYSIGCLNNVGGDFVAGDSLKDIDSLKYVAGDVRIPIEIHNSLANDIFIGGKLSVKRKPPKPRVELKFTNGKIVKLDRMWLSYEFGREHEEEIVKEFWKIIKKFKKQNGHDFIYQFYDERKGSIYKNDNGKYNPYYYRKWLSDDNINYYISLDEKEKSPLHSNWYRWQDKEPFFYLVNAAIDSACCDVIREAENNVREKYGFSKIGEIEDSGYSGSHLEQTMAMILGEKNIVFETEKTFEWLVYRDSMRIDFFIPEMKIAIECQGLQHFQPVEFFGGTQNYVENVKRDALKRRLCEEHGIKVLYYSNLGIDYPYQVYEDKDELLKAILSA